MKFKNYINEGVPNVSRQQSNWIKGVLILLVVFDHVDYFRYNYDAIFRPLTIHVTGFFALAFFNIVESKRQIGELFIERSVRYGVPFLIFYIFYAAGTFILQSEGDFNSFILGIIIGSFELVKKGCGGAFMWFLPALLGFVLLSKFVTMLNNRNLIGMIGFSIIFHIFLQGLITNYTKYIPLGFGVALYLIPIIFVFYIIRICDISRGFSGSVIGMLPLIIVAVGTYTYLVMDGMLISIGAEVAPPPDRVDLILSNFITNMSGLLIIFSIANGLDEGKVLSKVIMAIGSKSLEIYLIHPLFLKIFNIAIGRLNKNADNFIVIVVGVIAAFFAIGMSYGISQLFLKYPKIRMRVFPSNFRQFLGRK